MWGVRKINEIMTDKHLSEAAHYSSRLILAILDINNLNKL